MEFMDSIYDLIIVGGGPAGLSAAIYAGRSERQTLLLEKGSYGGRINDTYEIRNYPGTIVDSGQHLMERFREHAASHPTVELKRTTVTKIRKEGDLFVVETKRRGDFKAHSVVLDPGSWESKASRNLPATAWLTALPATRNFSRARRFMSWAQEIRPSRSRIT